MMKKVQIMYDYVFYVIYRFWEKAPSRWWSDWKAVITICFLIGFALSAAINTTIYVLNVDLVPRTKVLPIIISLIIFGLNYYYFLYKDKWRDRILRFENLNRKANRVGITLVVLIVGIIIGSLICSYYLLSIVDWQSKRFL
jgi:membrane associated rhomboid family serine protease